MSRVEQAVLAHIDEQETVGFLRRLIQTPSLAPPGDCQAMSQVCASMLQGARIPTKLLAAERNLPNVLATLKGGPTQPVLAFHAHMDTVPVEDKSRWNHEPFGGELIEGTIYGRGAGDDKGSLTAQIMAAKAIAEAGVQLRGTLLVCAVADEEEGGRRGTKWLRDEGYLQPDLLVIGEQTCNQIAVAERSMCRFELIVNGVGAHGAMPWKGVNAIEKMAKLICFLHDQLAPQLNARTHPFLPHSTMNIGTIQGGIKPNMVPEVCKITIDRRLLPEESPESAESEIRKVIDAFSSQVEAVNYQLSLFAQSWPAVNTDPASNLVKVMEEAIRDVTGEERPVVGYNQGSDGRFFATAGIPVVIFGPSDPAVGHAPNEHITVRELLEATRVYALTALRLLRAAD